MKHIFIFLFILILSACSNNFEDTDGVIVKTSLNEIAGDTEEYRASIHVPKNIEECFEELDKMFSDSLKNEIISMSEDEFSSSSHFGIGMWIRNYWVRNDDNTLKYYFYNIGINHPDDMSGIILDSYHRYLTKQKIDLDSQIKYYHDYWTVNILPNDSTFPIDAKNYSFDTKFIYTPKSRDHGVIHVGISKKSDSIWLYDYYFGWKKVPSAILKSLNDNTRHREEILENVFKQN
jgi:hypothetical protein